MIKLSPDWALNYEEYWKTIKSRNVWFIQIRYIAVVMFVTLFLVAHHILKINFSAEQLDWFIIISVSIAFYNIILNLVINKVTCTPNNFNQLHLSLIQMCFDLVALTLIVYFTGHLETPLYMLFFFHMIIGSLILPRKVILVVASLLVISLTGITALEFNGHLTHYHIEEIYATENIYNLNFIYSSLVIFIFTIYTTVGITSRIANRLYKREQQLKETLEELNKVEEAKQKYIMAVVHEIKSPIVAVQSIIEIIKKGYLGKINEKIDEKLSRTIIRTNDALMLINNILRISKLKLLGGITYDKVDLLEVLNKVLNQQSETLQNKKIKHSFIDHRSENILIDSDSVMLELIISNIVGNAIKYTKEKEEIKIELFDDLQNIKLEVSDRGIGIPEKEIKMIFQQFYRATNLPSKHIEGSGLGLSLVKEIVERFNGSISVKSPSKIGDKKNPGTIVSIILPISQGL